MDDFLIRALAGGIGVALVAGPLGSFVVWRRMAYFGATLSHAALLGIALGLLVDLNVHVGILLVCLAVSLLLLALHRSQRLATDTLLGILAHTTLALGLVVLSFMDSVRVDLLGYLFGDILAVSRGDLVWIFAGGALALAALAYIWSPLLLMTVHEELALVEGVAVERVSLAFMLVLSIVIAVAMQIVGLLLIVSLLIIPAATARRMAVTPEGMAALASVAGCIAVAAGLGSSLQWDTPAGPSIVLAASLLFAASLLLPKRLAG